MDNLLGAIRGSQPPPAASFAFPGAGRDGPLPTGSVGGFEGAKTGRPGDGGVSSRPAPAGAMADVKQSPGHPGRVIGVGAQAMDHGVRLLGAGTKEDGLDSEEEDEAAPLDIDDLLEEPLCEKVKGLGTFYILIDKHSRRRKRGFTGLRRSQKAAIVR